MKLALTIAAIAFSISACQAQSNSPTPKDAPSSTVPAQSQKLGAFVKDAHDTSGDVRIVTEKGQKYLDISNLSTDSGPDLFVVLHRSLPPKDYEAKNYLNLGKLQKTQGSQRYVIPANVKPEDFKSAAIWCRQFNVTFGYAPLKK